MIKAEELSFNSPSIDVLRLELVENRPTKSDILSYKPEVYLNPLDPEHGLQHTMNTVIVVDTLFTLQRNKTIKLHGNEGIFTERNRHVVKMAVSYHDSFHSVKIEDIDHGNKAANWILVNSLDEDKELIAELIRAHVPDDNEDMSVLLMILKDADSLERVRAPKDSDWYLKPKYLRLDESHSLIEPLTQVNDLEKRLLEDGYYEDGADLAIAAFLQVGWIKDE